MTRYQDPLLDPGADISALGRIGNTPPRGSIEWTGDILMLQRVERPAADVHLLHAIQQIAVKQNTLRVDFTCCC